MPMNLRARQQLAANEKARAKQTASPTLSPPQEPPRNGVAGRDKAVSGERVVQGPTSLNRAAKSLNNLLINERRGTTLQPTTRGGPVPMANAGKRKRGQTVEVQIPTQTKATISNPAGRLNRPTHSTVTVSSSAPTRGDIFEIPQQSPERPMKLVKTRSEARSQPDQESRPASVTRSAVTNPSTSSGVSPKVIACDVCRKRRIRCQHSQGTVDKANLQICSPPHRSGLRSQEPPGATSQSASTAVARTPDTRGAQRKRKPPQRDNRSTKKNKNPKAPARKSPTPSPSEYDTGLEEQEQLFATREEAERNRKKTNKPRRTKDAGEPATVSDQEESGSDEGDQENDTTRVNGQDEERNDHDEGRSEPGEDNDSQSEDGDDPEENADPQGENQRDEYTETPFNIYDHGSDWRLMMKTAARVKFKADMQPDDTWVTTLMGQIKVVKSLFKEIIRHGEASDHARGLENRVDTSLAELKQWLSRLSDPPIQTGKKAVKKEDPQRSNQLQDIYGAAIPSLISVLKWQLRSRYQDNDLDMKNLEQLVALQKAVIGLCKKAKAWNACTLVIYRSPKVKDVHKFITLPLERICAAFEDDLKKGKDAEAEKAAQKARLEAQQERDRREEEEEKIRKEEREREDKKRRIKTAEILARRKRERAERIPLPSFLLHASRRGLSIERSRLGSLNNGGARSSAPGSSQSRSLPTRRKAGTDPSRLRSSFQRDVADEDDVALSDEELACLLVGLAQFKGKDRVARILETYGARCGTLEFLTAGDVRTHIESLKNGGLPDNQLDILGLR